MLTFFLETYCLWGGGSLFCGEKHKGETTSGEKERDKTIPRGEGTASVVDAFSFWWRRGGGGRFFCLLLVFLHRREEEVQRWSETLLGGSSVRVILAVAIVDRRFFAVAISISMKKLDDARARATR